MGRKVKKPCELDHITWGALNPIAYKKIIWKNKTKCNNLAQPLTVQLLTLKKNRPRNKAAQQLSDGRYQPRVVESKKVYNRKKHGKNIS